LFANSTAVLKNTILAYNNGPNCVGVIDGGHNLSSDASGNFSHPFSLENIDPLLGPLADNGGPTLTLALLPGTPPSNGGNKSVCATTDQRGLARPAGADCDVGAVEATNANPGAGILQMGAVTNVVTEGNTDFAFTVVRAGGTEGTVSVSFATSNETAIAGADFVATNGVVAFGPGQRSNSFNVRIVDDSVAEDVESLHLTLFNPTGGAALGRATASLTIVDNDVSLQFSASSYAAAENIGNTSITVTRVGATNGTVTVNY